MLSRGNGIAQRQLHANVSIIPTDSITVPDVEPIQPIQDQIATALDRRPEVTQQRLQIDTNKVTLFGLKNGLLPSFNIVGNVSNPGVGGLLNPTPNINPQTGAIVDRSVGLNPDYIGGYPNILRQVFGANTINYTIGFTVNIPLKNTSDREAYIQQELQIKQNDLALQKQISQVRVDVVNGQIGVTNARSQYQSAVKSRQIFQQVYDAEVQKLALGASTPYPVTQHLDDLTNAKLTELPGSDWLCFIHGQTHSRPSYGYHPGSLQHPDRRSQEWPSFPFARSDSGGDAAQQHRFESEGQPLNSGPKPSAESLAAEAGDLVALPAFAASGCLAR